MLFFSYHWDPGPLDPAVRRLAAQLGQGNNVQGRRTMLAMLNHADPAARGIAMDHFCMARAQLRHGGSQEDFSKLDSLMHKTARTALREPPVAGGATESAFAANHASALNILAFLAEEEDLPVVTDFLERSDNANLLVPACQAAALLLDGREASAPRCLAALGRLWEDADQDLRLREDAAIACLGYRGPGSEALLQDILKLGIYEVSGWAALKLLERDPAANRQPVLALAARHGWTLDDGRFPGLLIQEILES